MGNERIACIILNWNGGQESIKCVESLLKSTGVSLRVLVIDNGSTDGSDNQLEKSFPEIIVLRNHNNVGVAKAWNIGVQWAAEQGSKAVFFLNNDAVVEESCLMLMKTEMDRLPVTGIVSPRILDNAKTGRVWFDGGFVNWFGDPVHRHRLPMQEKENQPQDFATGCAMLVRSNVFDSVGAFDESYFAYSEDSDFCLRAKAQGFSILHVPNAVAMHFPSSATISNRGKWFRDYYVTRNKLRLVRLYSSGGRWLMFLPYFVLKYVAVPTLYFVVTRQWNRIGAVIDGVRDFGAGRFGERYT